VWSTTPAAKEIRRKQKILRDAGIRGIWFVRLRRNRRYNDGNFIKEWETPVFGFRMMEDSSTFTVSKFGVKLDQFIAGMLSGKLAWVPQKKDSAKPWEDRTCLTDVTFVTLFTAIFTWLNWIWI
jgi:hypothetical protein